MDVFLLCFFFVFRLGSSLWYELIIGSEESYRLCMCEWVCACVRDLET